MSILISASSDSEFELAASAVRGKSAVIESKRRIGSGSRKRELQATGELNRRRRWCWEQGNRVHAKHGGREGVW
ncbi:hypothetical protein SLA2020_465460 [Shorea laevis]